jgi:integrase
MRRVQSKLTSRFVASAKEGRYCDGAGLYLVVTETSRKWAFRFTRQGKVTEMGLGGVSSVTLAQAREKAVDARKLVAAGVNPIEAKRDASKAKIAKPTFGEVADELIAAKSSEWRNAKHRGQWKQTLGRYAEPLRGLPVDEIDMAAVLAVLKPLWTRAPETASRLRGRIEAVLGAAKSRKLRSGENPAAWRDNLDHWLPRRQKLERPHLPAMHYSEIPSLLAKLRDGDRSIPSFALEIAILTAARSGEVLGARWDEIDLEARVWTLPASRMKAGREHRVPLSTPVMSILAAMSNIRHSELVFPGRKRGKPYNEGALLYTLKQIGADGATVHGFRSSFRDWCGNETSFPREIAEQALAHATGSAVEQAYRRGDALEKRRALMDAWAAYCEPQQVGNVVKIRSATI